MKAQSAYTCTCIGIGNLANKTSSICGVPQQWELHNRHLSGLLMPWNSLGSGVAQKTKGCYFEMVFLNVLIEPFQIQNHAIFATFLFPHQYREDIFIWRVYSRLNNTQFRQVSNFWINDFFFIWIKLNSMPWPSLIWVSNLQNLNKIRI